MDNILYENFTTGSKTIYLNIISVLSIFLGIYIIITKNPILSVLFLIGLFCSISIYLILIGLYFIGLSYLLVYIGAVSILFLFILMLINVRISELLTDNKNSIPLAVLILVLFNYSIYDTLPYSVSIFDIVSSYITTSFKDVFFEVMNINYVVNNENVTSVLLDYLTFLNVGNVKSKSWDSILIENSHITSIGNMLYTSHYILFMITSFILLLAMVGAIVITVNRIVSNVKSYNN